MPEEATLPALALEITEHDGTAVVRCRGKLLAETAEQLYAPVAHLLTTHGRVALDLSDLTQMDSMGLGALVRLYARSKKTGCSLELRNLGKKVRDLLILTNLLPAFTITGECHIRL